VAYVPCSLDRQLLRFRCRRVDRSTISNQPEIIHPLRNVRQLHCKKHICISTDILWRVFRILTEPVPYTFVSVNRRNNEARTGHIAMCAAARIRNRRYTDIFTVYVYTIRVIATSTQRARRNDVHFDIQHYLSCIYRDGLNNDYREYSRILLRRNNHIIHCSRSICGIKSPANPTN